MRFARFYVVADAPSTGERFLVAVVEDRRLAELMVEHWPNTEVGHVQTFPRIVEEPSPSHLQQSLHDIFTGDNERNPRYRLLYPH